MADRVRNSLVEGLVAGSLLALLSLSVNAQVPAQSDTAVPPEAASPEAPLPDTATTPIEDAKIDKFADAYIAVQEIQSQASQQLSATTDAQKADQVKQSAETQMIQAVERTGLQVDEFNQIAQAMAADATVRERVVERIDERKRST